MLNQMRTGNLVDRCEEVGVGLRMVAELGKRGSGVLAPTQVWSPVAFGSAGFQGNESRMGRVI